MWGLRRVSGSLLGAPSSPKVSRRVFTKGVEAPVRSLRDIAFKSSAWWMMSLIAKGFRMFRVYGLPDLGVPGGKVW